MLSFLFAVAVWLAPLDHMREQIVADAVRIHRQTGLNPYIIASRIQQFEADVSDAEAAPEYAAAYREHAEVERSFAASIAGGSVPRLARTAGAHMYFFGSPGDGEPFSVYVPHHSGPYGVVVILHGRGQSSSSVVSYAYIQKLAEDSDTILVAPEGYGDDLWDQSATREVLAELDEVQKTFAVDARRVYLAGISMGGAGVFHIGAAHADRFAGFLSIVGDLAQPDAATAVRALADRRIYMVSGGKDPIMTPAVVSGSIQAFERRCVPVSHYEAPDAGHDLVGVSAQVAKAWTDMMAGITRGGTSRECSGLP